MNSTPPSWREIIGVNLAVVALGLAFLASVYVGNLEPVQWTILFAGLALGVSFAPRLARRL